MWKGVELAEKVADELADASELEALFTSPESKCWDIHAANEPSFAEEYFTGYPKVDAARMAFACLSRKELGRTLCQSTGTMLPVPSRYEKAAQTFLGMILSAAITLCPKNTQIALFQQDESTQLRNLK